MNKILIQEGLQFYQKLPQIDRLFYKEARRGRVDLLKRIEKQKLVKTPPKK